MTYPVLSLPSPICRVPVHAWSDAKANARRSACSRIQVSMFSGSRCLPSIALRAATASVGSGFSNDSVEIANAGQVQVQTASVLGAEIGAAAHLVDLGAERVVDRLAADDQLPGQLGI